MEFKRKASFEKYFRDVVINFDETKIWFEHPGKMYNESKICFVLDGKLVKLPMYKHMENVDRWAQHFKEFLDTGVFEMSGYWELYNKKDISPDDIGKVYKFPLTESHGNKFYTNSKELQDFLHNYRKSYPNCGIRPVPKPFYNPLNSRS